MFKVDELIIITLFINNIICVELLPITDQTMPMIS
jgi:cell division protein FtsW (lipid II flippase)